jgi:ATP-dependent Lhr-like helicase
VEVVSRDLSAPSPLAHAILNARPFAFLDDGAAEERRTRAVSTHPLMDVKTAADLGRLDPEAIARVREEAWPEIGSADELHDALVVLGFLTAAEMTPPKRRIVGPHAPPVAAPQGGSCCGPTEPDPRKGLDGVYSCVGDAASEPWRTEIQAAGDAVQWIEPLQAQRRATVLQAPGGALLHVAAERLHELRAVLPTTPVAPAIDPVKADRPAAVEALRELARGRLEGVGPTTAAALGAPLGLAADAVLPALLMLEAEGSVLRGAFSHAGADEWCDRRLLARIHRYTRDRLRAEIQPVPPAQFMRFLFRWHRLASSVEDDRREGEAGVVAALRQLEGYAAPAGAWEEDLLLARVKDYEPDMLDRLCATGRVAWWRPADEGEPAARRSGPIRGTPVLLGEREGLAHWQQAAGTAADDAPLSARAQRVREVLRTQGASFFADLQHEGGLLGTEVEQALGELVAQGLATCDSFAGLRALVMTAEQRRRLRRRRAGIEADLGHAGRWSLTRRPRTAADAPSALADPHVEHIARVLLRRYGVVFRKLLEREDGLPPWRDLHYVLRRLEARGEVRGGRFVSGFSGEQFALPEAAAALRKTARTEGRERVSISAADPLNLAGIVTPGDKVPRLPGNRLLFDGGVPIAVQSGGEVRYLAELAAAAQWEVRNLLIRKHRPGSYVQAPTQAH